MRCTLTIDDDVYLLARDHARLARITVGAAISRLARAGLRTTLQAGAAVGGPVSKYALLPRRAEIITTEHVRN